MTLIALFEAADTAAERAEQHRQLARVSTNIASTVVDFWLARLQGQRTFRLDELTSYVREQTGCNPSSPDRVLRDLRAKRRLNYRVLSRSGSYYEALMVEATPEQAAHLAALGLVDGDLVVYPEES